jgi:Ca2+-binding RTX toxin-like protein
VVVNTLVNPPNVSEGIGNLDTLETHKINWVDARDRLEKVLQRIQSAINSQIYGVEGLKNTGNLENLPFFGDSLKTVNSSQFIEEWSNKIKEKFNEKFSGTSQVSPQDLQQAIFEIFGSSGLKILKDSDDPGNEITKDDIKVVQNGTLATFDFDLGGTKTFNVALPANLGLPQVGLEYRNPATGEAAQPQASADLDFTFDFGFGVDSVNDDFFFNVSPEKDLSLSLKPSLPQAEAKFGFLVGDAKDIGSQIQFAINLGDGNDNQLRLNELSNLIINPEGAADIKLNFVSKTDFSNVQKPTQLGTDLNIHWDFIEGALQPSVKLENISLELGSFLADFLAPIVDPIQKVTDPIGKVYDLLTDTKLTVLPGDPTLLDLAKDIPSPLLQVGLFGVDLIGQADRLLDTISNSADQLTNLTLDLGDINLGSFDLRDLFASTEKAQTIALNSKSLAELRKEIPIGSQYDTYRKFFDLILSDKTGGIFSLPILQGGEAISKIFLGQAYKNLGLNQRNELFSVDLENLNFQLKTADDKQFSLSDFLGIPIPDFGLDGEIGLALNFKASYDSYGIQQWAKNYNFDPQKISVLADGLILDDHREGGKDKPEIMLSAGISGSASIRTPPVLPFHIFGTAKANAGIAGSVSIDLEDIGEAGSNLGDSDGTLRGSEILQIAQFDPKAIIDFGGQIIASLSGSYTNTIPIPFFDDVVTNVIPPISKLKTYDLQKFGLLPSPNKVPILADNGPDKFSGGSLELNMGMRANNRLFINTTDQSENFSLLGTGSSEKDTITVTAFGKSQNYSNVTKIVADAGNFDDVIEVESIAIPVDFSGGNGDDTLSGGSADDILSPGRGADRLDGKGGNDTVSYANAERGASVDLATGKGGIGELSIFGIPKDGLPVPRFARVYEDELSTFRTIFSQTPLFDKLQNIENVVGSIFSDHLSGNSGDNKLEGGKGDDTLAGGRGADLFDGGLGNDTVSYADSERGVSANLETQRADNSEIAIKFQLGLPPFVKTFEQRIFEDQLSTIPQDIPFLKILSQETLFDRLENIENLIGSSFADRLAGNSADNHLEGKNGDDVLQGGQGNDLLDGGLGNDTASYISSQHSVYANLETQQASIGEVQIALKSPFANLLPTIQLRVFEDELSGIALSLANQILNQISLPSLLQKRLESLIKQGTSQLIKGLLDVKPLFNRLENIENLEGSVYEDRLIGNSGENSISGGNGGDLIAGGLGNDTIYGGDGDDVLRGDRNESSPGGKTGGNDIIYGGKGNDRIGGKGGNDQLYGQEGDDQIWGDDGDDLLWGGLGNDTLTGDDFSGGKGSDTFAIAIGEGTDTIVDFKIGLDLIGLAGDLSFGQLTRTQQGNDTWLESNNEVLAVLTGVRSNLLTQSSFVSV